jgi:hypothetical protein
VVESCEIVAPTALSPGEKPTEPICKVAGWKPVSVDTVENREVSVPSLKSNPDAAVAQYIGIHYTEWFFGLLIARKIIEGTDNTIVKW